MNMIANIREACAEDVAALGAVHVQCWRESYAELLSQPLLDSIRPEDRATRWEQIIASPNDRQWVAEGDGEIVGFAGTAPGRARCRRSRQSPRRPRRPTAGRSGWR